MSYIYGKQLDYATVDHIYFAQSYWNVFMRMDVYFVGFLFGVLLRNCKESPHYARMVNRPVLLVGWIVCAFFMLGALYGPYTFYHNDIPQDQGLNIKFNRKCWRECCEKFALHLRL